MTDEMIDPGYNEECDGCKYRRMEADENGVSYVCSEYDPTEKMWKRTPLPCEEVRDDD